MQMHKIMQENYEWEIIALYYYSKNLDLLEGLIVFICRVV